MKTRFFKYIKAIISRSTIIEMYDNRRSLLKQTGERNRYTIILGSTMVVLCFAMLTATTWIPSSIKPYLSSKSDIFSIPNDSINWQATNLANQSCDSTNNCVESMSDRLKPVTLDQIDQIKNNQSDSPLLTMLRLNIDKKSVEKLSNNQVFVIILPDFDYKSAQIFLGSDQHLNTFFNNRKISVTLPSNTLSSSEKFIEINIALQVAPDTERSIAGTRNEAGVLASSQREFTRYEEYLATKNSRAVGAMGSLSKIAVALFCLLLFLIVDSSPESLGLSLFMGFEALALGIGKGWLPLGIFGIGGEAILTNFCYQMGDIMKLYFLLQLARIGRPNPFPWLIGGLLISIPYGFFMQYAQINDLTWVYKIPRTRDTLVGTIGCIFCLRALFSLRKENLPWRKTALLIGALAAAFEVSNSWIAHSEFYRIYPSFKTYFGIFQANIGIMFALSTFLNISTLENRVRMLSRERDQANEIKRQLEIGRSVQKSFLTIPKMPSQLGLSCHHEAAVYVSGDTYFVHWDDHKETLTFLLNDVTGHGVQAALKAFASNTIAKNIWGEGSSDENHHNFDQRYKGSRLEQYDKMIDQLICQQQGEAIPDFNAMIGAEFQVKEGVVQLYRANYNFPILIEPEFDWTKKDQDTGTWQARSLAIANRELTEIKLKQGSFLVLLSDGYISSPREEVAFLKHTLQTLNNSLADIDSNELRQSSLSWLQNQKAEKADDRTILVFQWDQKSEAKGLTGPNMPYKEIA